MIWLFISVGRGSINICVFCWYGMIKTFMGIVCVNLELLLDSFSMKIQYGRQKWDMIDIWFENPLYQREAVNSTFSLVVYFSLLFYSGLITECCDYLLSPLKLQ
jgi:hypothetical protein